jgi:hypothetical protein
VVSICFWASPLFFAARSRQLLNSKETDCIKYRRCVVGECGSFRYMLSWLDKMARSDTACCRTECRLFWICCILYSIRAEFGKCVFRETSSLGQLWGTDWNFPSWLLDKDVVHFFNGCGCWNLLLGVLTHCWFSIERLILKNYLL